MYTYIYTCVLSRPQNVVPNPLHLGHARTPESVQVLASARVRRQQVFEFAPHISRREEQSTVGLLSSRGLPVVGWRRGAAHTLAASCVVCPPCASSRRCALRSGKILRSNPVVRGKHPGARRIFGCTSHFASIFAQNMVSEPNQIPQIGPPTRVPERFIFGTLQGP